MPLVWSKVEYGLFLKMSGVRLDINIIGAKAADFFSCKDNLMANA